MEDGLVVYQTLVPYQTVAQIVCIKILAAVMMITTIPPWLNIFRVHMHQYITAPKSSKSNQRRSYTAPYTRQPRANTSVLIQKSTTAPKHLAHFMAHDSMAIQSISSSDHSLAPMPLSMLVRSSFRNHTVRKNMAIHIQERSLTLAPTPLSTLALSSFHSRTVQENMAILILERSLTHAPTPPSTAALKRFHNCTVRKNMATLIQGRKSVSMFILHRVQVF